MTARRALPLLLALLAAAAVPSPEPRAQAPEPAPPAAAPPPATALPPRAPLAERLRHNPRERAARGLEAWEDGRFADADAAFHHALRLDPGAGDAAAADPLLLFDAGTARLAAGAPGEAAELLEAAAERTAERAAEYGAEGDDLPAAARYNLGNARYAGGDFAAAAEAFRATLRRDPGHAAAKHNLELALRRLEEQRRQQQAGEGGGERPPEPDGEEGEGEERGERGGEGESPDGRSGGEEPPEPQPEPGGGERGETPPEPGGEPGGERERPLPGFEDQPDMTAEQAAAILEAVEGLERQRRQAAAAERARRQSAGRDW